MLHHAADSIVNILLVLASLGFFCFKMVQLAKWWRRDAPAVGWRVAALLLPALVIGLMLLLALPAFFRGLPAPQESLSTVTAPIEQIRRYTHKTQATKSKPLITYTYVISLKGHREKLYLPDRSTLEPNEFVHWANEEPITFRYASLSERPTIYEISRADGDIYRTYQESSRHLAYRAWTALSSQLFMGLILAALVSTIPRSLSAPGSARARRARLTKTLWAVALVIIMLILEHLHPSTTTTDVTDTPGCAHLTAQLCTDVQVALPVGWEERTDKHGSPWYQGVPDIATQLVCADIPKNTSNEAWCWQALDDYRAFLFKTLITTPLEEPSPFLTRLETWERSDGQALVISQGWGLSKSKRRNHFLLVLCPQAEKLIAIRSSSSKVSLEELEVYVEEWIFPLLDHLTVADSQVLPSPTS